MSRTHLENYIRSLYRIVIGLLFFCHGLASVFGLLGGGYGGHRLVVGAWPGWWAALIQVVAGGLVMIGLGTRPAALLASGSMAYAYFTVHVEQGIWPIQNGGEIPVLFCWSFLLLVLIGAGPLSLDALIVRARKNAARNPVEPAARPTPVRAPADHPA